VDLEFRELIRQGIAEGSIAPCDPKLAAFTVAGALSWIGRWYRPDGALTPEAIADHSVTMLLRRPGVAPPVAPAPRRRRSPA